MCGVGRVGVVGPSPLRLDHTSLPQGQVGIWGSRLPPFSPSIPRPRSPGAGSTRSPGSPS